MAVSEIDLFCADVPFGCVLIAPFRIQGTNGFCDSFGGFFGLFVKGFGVVCVRLSPNNLFLNSPHHNFHIFSKKEQTIPISKSLPNPPSQTI
jgi:hypothetical protein